MHTDLHRSIGYVEGRPNVVVVGGGFGGCTLNLVRTADTQEFIESVLHQYRSQVDEVPRSFTFELVGGAEFSAFPPLA